MNSPKSYQILAVVVILIVGAYYFGKHTERSRITQSQAAKAIVAPSIARDHSRLNSVGAVASDSAESARQARYFRPAYVPLGSGYDNVLLVYAERLKGVSLTVDQEAAMQDVFTATFEQRERLEVSLAKVTVLPSGTTQIDIPTYFYQGGEELKNNLAAQYERILGDKLAGDVLHQIGGAIARSNNFYGQYPQQLEIEVDSAKNLYNITLTINPNTSPGTFKYVEKTIVPLNYSTGTDFTPYLKLVPTN